MNVYAEIIVEITNIEVDKIFHYKIPDNIENIVIGMRVIIPFGKSNKKIEGYIIGFTKEINFPESKLKYILEVCDEFPIFTKETIELAKWMKDKYYCTLTQCLQCIIPAGINLKGTNKIKYAELTTNIDIVNKIKFKAQYEVLKLLSENGKMSIKSIQDILKISESPINTLKKNNLILITEEEVIKDPYNLKQYKCTEAFTPTTEQEKIIDYIKICIDNKQSETFLIHGVTGSGKTEIYLQLIQYVLGKGKQAIVLVPEISLTPQTVSRFASRFGEKIAVTHSKMSAGERIAEWNRARTGNASIMIGPRSAIFAPFENLGIIIIDEEHESTYKSEVTPKYHAREIAQKRCELTTSKLILGSATPSLESYYQATQGNIHLLKIKNRAKNNMMPQINIIDMRQEIIMGNKSIFSEELSNEIKYNITKKEQTMLFLNRRGHSTFVSCRKCGYVAKCIDCNLPYTYHQDKNFLLCHHCGKSEKNPLICPQCGSKYIKYFGVGTQKVEEETKKMFPQARVERMDMDTTSKKHSHEQILNRFANGEIDILIGTQMIAKGHDFPNITLVGVIAADLSLNIDDFRGSEITFQLLTQVSGRAGRAELSGTVFIQTYNPESYAIALAKTQDYEKFYNEEISLRKMMNYPPYSNIFIILIFGENEKSVITSIHKFMEILNYYNKKNNFELLGPVPASISKIKKQYRWKIMIKCNEEERLKNYAIYCLNKFKVAGLYSSDISISMNMNPMSFI